MRNIHMSSNKIILPSKAIFKKISMNDFKHDENVINNGLILDVSSKCWLKKTKQSNKEDTEHENGKDDL